jgi:hypothetical protein
MKKLNLSFNVKPYIQGVQKWWNKFGPKVLTGVSIASWSAAVVTGIKATPEAMELLEKRKKELEVEKLSVKETVLTAGKCYIPTVAFAAGGATCSIGAAVGYEQKLMSAASALELARRAADTSDLYRQKAEEILTPKKNEEIKQEVAKDIANREESLSPHGCIVHDPNGVLIKESWSGVVFRDDLDKVERLMVDLARRQKKSYDSSVTYFDWMSMLDLEYPECGVDLCWDATQDGDYILPEFTVVKAANNPYKEDMYVITYDIRPTTECSYKY